MNRQLFALLFGVALLLAPARADDDEEDDDDESEDSASDASAAEGWEENGAVLHLTTESFAAARKEHPKMLTMFYAPWCGHCKAMKPDFAKASVTVKDDMAFAAVDCTVHTEPCETAGAKGYPTIIYFEDSDVETGEKYEGGRDEKGLTEFAQKKTGTYVQKPPEPWEENGHVVQLDDTMWEEHTKDKKVLAFFYAPWCGHCKTAKPEYAQASTETRGMGVVMAAVDCTSNTETCGKFDVKGYPTIKFINADGKAETYTDSRERADFVNFVNRHAEVPEAKDLTDADLQKMRVKMLRTLLKERGVECAGCTEKHEFVARVKETMHQDKVKPRPRPTRTWAQDRRAKEAKEAAEKGWEENGSVVHLTDDSFEDYRKEHPKTFVMFYAPWCGHCTSFKPGLAKASDVVKEDEIKIAAVDCDLNKDICQKYGANSYPTVKYFEDAETEGTSFDGARNEQGVVKFVKETLGLELPAEPEPEPWEENGEVVHLTDTTFEATRKEKGTAMMVMFYAPWCGHCKAMKPDYAKASEALKDEKVFLAAQDCTSSNTICSKHGASGFPTVMYFEDADVDEGEKYESGRDESSIVEWIKGKLSGEGNFDDDDEDDDDSSSDDDEL